MQETRPVAFKFFGEVGNADQYQGLARIMLGWVRDQLAPLSLKVGKRSMTLPDGTYIEVTVVGEVRTAYIFAPGFPLRELPPLCYDGIFILQLGSQTTATIIDYGARGDYTANANAKLPWYAETTRLPAPMASDDRIYWIGLNPHTNTDAKCINQYVTLTWLVDTDSPDIYRMGRPFMRAPATVYGVGIFGSWLIAACYDSASFLKFYYKRFPADTITGSTIDLETDLFDSLLSDAENASRWREVDTPTFPNPYPNRFVPFYKYVSFSEDGSKFVYNKYNGSGDGTKYSGTVDFDTAGFAGKELIFTLVSSVVPDDSDDDTNGYITGVGATDTSEGLYWERVQCSPLAGDYVWNSSVYESGYWYAEVYDSSSVLHTQSDSGGLASAKAWVESFIDPETDRDHIDWIGADGYLNTETYKYNGIWYDKDNVQTGTQTIWMHAIYRWYSTIDRQGLDWTASIVGNASAKIAPTLGFYYDGDSEVEMTLHRTVIDNNNPSTCMSVTHKEAECYTHGPECFSDATLTYLWYQPGTATGYQPKAGSPILAAINGLSRRKVVTTQRTESKIDFESRIHWRREYINGTKEGTVYETVLRYQDWKFENLETMPECTVDEVWTSTTTVSTSVTKSPVSVSGWKIGGINTYDEALKYVPAFCPYSPTQVAIESTDDDAISFPNGPTPNKINYTASYDIADSTLVNYSIGDFYPSAHNVYSHVYSILNYGSDDWIVDATSVTVRDHRNLVVADEAGTLLHDFAVGGFDYSWSETPLPPTADYWVGTDWGKFGISGVYYIPGYPAYTYHSLSNSGVIEAVTSPDGDAIYNYNTLGSGAGYKTINGLFVFDDPTFPFRPYAVYMASTGEGYPGTHDDVMCIGRRMRTFTPEE